MTVNTKVQVPATGSFPEWRTGLKGTSPKRPSVVSLTHLILDNGEWKPFFTPKQVKEMGPKPWAETEDQ